MKTITATSRPPLRRLLLPAFALATLAVIALAVVHGVDHGPFAHLLQKAVGFEDSNQQVAGNDFGRLFKAGSTLLPLGLVLTVAAFPIVCIVGGVCMAVGARIGVRIVAMAFGACLFMAVLGGISK